MPESKQYFQKIDFNELKSSLGVDATIEADWSTQPNGVLVKPLIPENESERLNLTYISLIFPNPTDGHNYKTQTDTIHFLTEGKIEFCLEDRLNERKIVSFSQGDAIQIAPSVVRKLSPIGAGGNLKIELIVQPKYNFEDEIHVYD